MMRRTLWMTIALSAAGLTVSPAHAQFAAEDADGAYDEADPAADPYAETESVDPYAAEQAYDPADPRSIGDRSVADLATSVLGAEGARRVQDAEAVVRSVIGKAAPNGSSPGSPGADPVGLVADILTTARKTKSPQ